MSVFCDALGAINKRDLFLLENDNTGGEKLRKAITYRCNKMNNREIREWCKQDLGLLQLGQGMGNGIVVGNKQQDEGFLPVS